MVLWYHTAVVFLCRFCFRLPELIWSAKTLCAQLLYSFPSIRPFCDGEVLDGVGWVPMVPFWPLFLVHYIFTGFLCVTVSQTREPTVAHAQHPSSCVWYVCSALRSTISSQHSPTALACAGLCASPHPNYLLPEIITLSRWC